MSAATLFTATYVEVVLSSAAQGVALLGELSEASRRDDGAVGIDVLGRMERRNQFLVLAQWQDEEAFTAYAGSERFARVLGDLDSLLAAPIDTRQHQALSVDESEESRGVNTITVVTHVDVVPQFKDDGAAALQKLAEDSREHTGNRRFDVWQQTNRPNHFTVVEMWSSLRSFAAHGSAAQTRAFRVIIAPMMGALYDERWYRTLDRSRR
jgi:quinol monooxygenase YgiN